MEKTIYPSPNTALMLEYRRREREESAAAACDRHGNPLAGLGTSSQYRSQPDRITDPELLYSVLEENLGLSPTIVFKKRKYQAPGIQGHWFVPLVSVSEEDYARLNRS